MIVDPGNGAAWPVLRGQPYPVAFSDLREAELQPLTKKFEGHGSGEVEVKTGKMLGAGEFSFARDQELGDIRLIVELFRSGMRGHLLLPASQAFHRLCQKRKSVFPDPNQASSNL